MSHSNEPYYEPKLYNKKNSDYRNPEQVYVCTYTIQIHPDLSVIKNSFQTFRTVNTYGFIAFSFPSQELFVACVLVLYYGLNLVYEAVIIVI